MSDETTRQDPVDDTLAVPAPVLTPAPAAPSAPGERTGKDLIKASRPFTIEDRARTWRLLAVTLAVQAGFIGGILLTDVVALKAVLAVFSALTTVRLFIFYHDFCHGAIFRGSEAGRIVMTVAGWWTMTVPSVWRETHNYHHRHNAKLIGSSIGSYPTVSLKMYRRMTPSQRRAMKAMRHPVSILLGLLTTFVIGMCFLPWKRRPEQHKLAPVTGIVWWSLFAAVGFGIGWQDAFFVWLMPAFLWSAAGSYLFYAQHNFPGAELRERRTWDYSHAALKCSSFFEMPGWMHWFTGNIGYHHVHHLNHNIPFYRLPEAMAALPELQSPGRTSWRPADIHACLQSSVWDGEQGRLISFAEADATL